MPERQKLKKVFHVKREGAKQCSQLSEGKFRLLERYVTLLDQWRHITNLISAASFAEVWDRHISDSVRIQQTCPNAVRWLDIGSGAGFPGLVIATLLSDYDRAIVHCVESDNRKCAFLRDVARNLKIPVKVHNRRAESISPALLGPVDAVTARAFASIDKILDFSQEFLRSGAVAVLPRGRTWEREVVAIETERYTVEATSHPNVILVIRQKVA